jgi:hypothetical protein
MIDDKDKRCEECYAGLQMLLRNEIVSLSHLNQKKCPLGYSIKQIPIRTEYRGSTYEKKIYVPKEPCIGPVDQKEFYYIKSLGDKK